MACSLLLRQLLLLLWKNFILQIRRPIGTIFELLIPALALTVVVGIRQIPGTEPKHTCSATFQSNYLQVSPDYGVIYYSPNSTNASEIIKIAVQKWPQLEGKLIGVQNQSEMVNIIMNKTGDNYDDAGNVCQEYGIAGVYFDSLEPGDIQYTVRFPYDPDWATNQKTNSFIINQANLESIYMSSGFINLQRVIEESIIAFFAGNNTPQMELAMRQFPFPSTILDPFLAGLSFGLPLLLMFSFIYTAATIVKELVIEKHSRIRESMLMMGLRLWVLWTSWILKQLLFMSIWVLAYPILLKYINVWPKTDLLLLIIFFLLYIMSIIAFGFVVSVWFNSPRIALITGFILFFINFIPTIFISSFYDKIPIGGKLALSLFSNTAFGLGVSVISYWEEQQLGLQWNNVAQPLSIEDPLNMGAVYGMLILDIVLYMLIAWYVDAVKPGQYGIPKPFYFPFLPSYWIGIARKGSQAEVEATGWHDPEAHEEEPNDLNVGISIRNLTKIYDQSLLILQRDKTERGKKLAVDGLSLNMYEGQITALLGHNGAGKTTTISILTGLYTPTDGTAVINGYDIRTNMDQIRHSMGICPQHNVLIDRLTVNEHLRLFAMLKGTPYKAVKGEVERMLEDLHLTDKKSSAAKYLSGGMKRKLSVGIALIGGSKVVVLDEPTSGMDPYARRATWDLLVKHKEGRTMLLTTHFMDEADLLGDRIAIMAEGRLMCSGSSLFLKRRYGVGYHLTLVKEARCDTGRLIQLVTSTVPGSRLATDIGAELSFQLPFSSSQHFPLLLDTLDEQRASLGFSSFGLSLTTMEEVFMKVGTGSTETVESRLISQSGRFGASAGAAANLQVTGSQQPAISTEFTISEKPSDKKAGHLDVPEDFDGHMTDEYHLLKSSRRHTGFTLWLQQFVAMFLKRFYNSLRYYMAVVTQLLVPMVFIFLALLLIKIPSPLLRDLPKLKLQLNSVSLSDNTTAFWAQFGTPPDFSLNVTSSSIHVKDFFDYTGRVEDIKESVGNTSDDTSHCCDYKFQLLDKFCASRTRDEFEKSCKGTSFGYNTCSKCLSCCSAQSTSAALSCAGGPEQYSDNFCPAPPELSIEDYLDNSTGLLDSDNTYVAELLLRTADNLQPSIFFQRVQAGFVLSYQEPVVSFCGWSNETLNTELSDLIGALYNYSTNTIDECESQVEECANFPEITCGCKDALECLGEHPTSMFALPAGYYKNLSYDVQVDFTNIVCEEVEECYKSASVTPQIYPAEREALTATVWYNNQPLHTVAAALNAFHNILLQQTLGEHWSITAYNHPLPRSQQTKEDQTFLAALQGLAFSVLGAFGFAFLISSFVIFPVQEKESKAKHLQYVSGVNPLIYWMGNYAWDMINGLVIIIIAFLLIVAFQTEGYQGQGLAAVLFLMVFTCWAGIPMAYVFSFIFKSHLVAYGVFFIIFFFPPLAFQLAVVLVTDQHTQNILFYLFLLHPGYGLQIGFANVYISQVFSKPCSSGSIPSCGGVYAENIFQFDRPGVGSILTYTAVEGVVLLLFVVLVEYSFFIPYIRRLILYYTDKTDKAYEQRAVILEDEDVQKEKMRVMGEEHIENDNIVVIKNMIKVYSAQLSGCNLTPPKRAVNGICLAIPQGEIFGFVGVNGAGKTTTFSILTGDISATSGTAIISGYDIRTDLRKVQQRIGYCPQFDALIERMTGRELLTMFARLRGIPEREIGGVVTDTIDKLDLSKYAKKLCGKYSGGNKRKLSTAIALIGDPPILFLDEPTTGMDPATRRYLWDVLTGLIKEGRSIILTTHSMEECEALCTRLTIMVNGEFKCLGSIQHLKNKFGSGYTLQAKIQSSDPYITPTNMAGFSDEAQMSSRPPQHESTGPTFNTTPLKHFVQEKFPGAMVLEEHQGVVTYQLPSIGVSWSAVFNQMETNKERLGIIDYSVSQTTLDQVFINFAKQQEGGAIEV